MSKHFGNNQRSRYFGTYPQIPNILAHTLKVQNILAPLIKFHQNILAPTLKFHQNILAPTLKFQIFWHLPSNFKYFGTYPQIPGPALICSRKPPDKHRKEWKSFWNNNSLWVGFNTAWWYFPPKPQVLTWWLIQWTTLQLTSSLAVFFIIATLIFVMKQLTNTKTKRWK